MEGFHELLLKVKEAHERAVEGWQLKVQELSNKKGCDTKRMEELFTRNQQMKEQQRILTENIKTLENRLRAGLCDRCTVTQEVAKRRQQEFEVSQIQSLQHITLLVGEMSHLKKENRRLREENGTLRAALKGNGDLHTDIKPGSSPDLSPSAGPTATVTSRVIEPPTEGDVVVKKEPYHRNDDADQRRIQSSMFGVPLSTLMPSPWTTEKGPSCAGDRRQPVEAKDPRTSSQTTPKNFSPSSSAEVKHIPCRPQPIKSIPPALPWNLPDTSDWVSVGALKPPRFPNLIPTGQYSGYSGAHRPGFGPSWHKPSSPHSPAKEPTIVFRVRSPSDQGGGLSNPKEKRDIQPSKVEVRPGEASKEHCDGPLDLSDRGKTKSSQSDSPSSSNSGERRTSEMDLEASPLSSPSKAAPPKQEEFAPEPLGQAEQREESGAEQGTDKVSVLTLSLRPVVVLESLKPTLQKQESSTTNGQSSSAASGLESSSEEGDEEEGRETASGPESNQSYKRKRTSDLNGHQERKVKITLRAEDQSYS
ncbi:uncharacterized protein rbbp8l [Synchiropus splendidus]|uniref:uncharacterized protein rbbp8l n=1 Tax=Synchiropus splendidus TaxID=270530 RepID=UPI00237D44E2|nr:uncharacterized protein rbbp8l [Synchiropus splendidus]